MPVRHADAAGVKGDLMKILLMMPLMFWAAGAGAQDVGQQGAARLEPPQKQDMPGVTVAPGKETQRQGADMRHCLDLKNHRDIIRCAEPGRKP